MPRDVDPGTIKTGPGKTVPGETTLTLGGAGMAGAGPNIGDIDGTPPIGGGADSAGLAAHVNSGKAHSASSIYTSEGPDTVYSTNVEGQLDELAGALPPEPPQLGFEHAHLTFTGIPDWGSLKLGDASILDRSLLVSTHAAADIFPYYYVAPSPALDSPEFDNQGGDPETDPTFNSGNAAGVGDAYAGGFTRPPTGPAPAPVVLTTAIMERGGSAQSVTLSGAIYPADRGVLALMHWPPGGNEIAFVGQSLLDRCKCALLLGQGISGQGACADASDGEPGGIFDPGSDTNAEYDPFSYPGQATGQYDLREINLGVSLLDGVSPLKAPFDDYDGDAGPGATRASNTEVQGPGQVRLGTAADAGETPTIYGIPVLGATEDMYSPSPGATLGDISLSPGNFFRYRLPYLNDYSQATGLKYTPSGQPGTELTTKERFRYFSVPINPLVYPPNTGTPVDVAGGATELAQAGDFSDFPGDHYPWQVARYRQTFSLKHTGGAFVAEDHGTYFVVHFKTEKDFESFVRDGVMPDDVTDGYEVYSAYTVPGSTGIEETDRRVNEETSTTVPSPAGPAPDYGYSALPYHTMKANIFEDPDDHVTVTGDVTQAISVFTSTSTPGAATEFIMWSSGVAYFTPRNHSTGATGTNLIVEWRVGSFWDSSYRTDDRQLSGALGTDAPALLSSPCPAFVGLAPFAYEDGSFSVPTGVPPGGITPSTSFLRRQRIEIPLTHLGDTTSGYFTAANGPLSTDVCDILGGPLITLTGDDRDPAFSSDAKPRAYFRRPFNHRATAVTDVMLPYSALGGHGSIGVDTSGDIFLFHSTNFNTASPTANYGNFRNAGAAPQVGYAATAFADKDNIERFLDEVYRYENFPSGTVDALYGTGAEAAVNGPGMGTWAGGPVETPIRIGHVPSPSVWQASSWVQNDVHLASLAVLRLQVGGLPDRNPPLTDGVLYPFPTAGLLQYPQTNYSVGYQPATATHMTAAQPDYSALAGLRLFVRCFDATVFGAASAAGDSTVVLRIDGLQLQDFAYSAPGPGDLAGTTGIALLVKVPGLTTWMDVGRVDGAGPSKQDTLLDGAGCQVVGPDTVDGVDANTGMVYAQVKIDVGPAANLFAMTGLHGASGIDAADVGKVPLLVQVRMDTAATAFDLTDEYDPATKTFAGTPGPGIESAKVRGITGIQIITV